MGILIQVFLYSLIMLVGSFLVMAGVEQVKKSILSGRQNNPQLESNDSSNSDHPLESSDDDDLMECVEDPEDLALLDDEEDQLEAFDRMLGIEKGDTDSYHQEVESLHDLKKDFAIKFAKFVRKRTLNGKMDWTYRESKPDHLREGANHVVSCHNEFLWEDHPFEVVIDMIKYPVGATSSIYIHEKSSGLTIQHALIEDGDRQFGRDIWQVVRNQAKSNVNAKEIFEIMETIEA